MGVMMLRKLRLTNFCQPEVPDGVDPHPTVRIEDNARGPGGEGSTGPRLAPRYENPPSRPSHARRSSASGSSATVHSTSKSMVGRRAVS